MLRLAKTQISVRQARCIASLARPVLASLSQPRALPQVCRFSSGGQQASEAGDSSGGDVKADGPTEAAAVQLMELNTLVSQLYQKVGVLVLGWL